MLQLKITNYIKGSKYFETSMQHFSLKIHKLKKKKLSLCDSGIWRAAWLEDTGFFFVFFKFQPKFTFTLKSYKVWKLSDSTVSQCCCCHQSRLRELVILKFKSKHLKLKCSSFCATFYATRLSEPHSKALSWHDSSLLLCCCPSVHLQLRLLPSAFCPTGVFYSDGQTWRLPAHCCSKISLYGQKEKKKIRHKLDVLWVVVIHWGKENTYQGEIWYTQTPDEADEEWYGKSLLQGEKFHDPTAFCSTHGWMRALASFLFPKVSTVTPRHVPLLLLHLEKGQKLLEHAFSRGKGCWRQTQRCSSRINFRIFNLTYSSVKCWLHFAFCCF